MSGTEPGAAGAARRILVLLCAGLIAVQVVRIAAVAALANAQPQAAARLWPGHPDVEAQQAMVTIASAVRNRQPIPAEAFAALDDTARKAPLSSQPFLVRGVQAQLRGQPRLSRAAFGAAERRDPRSLPARYFLADQDLREGNAAHGLGEFAAMAALTPDGASAVAPFVARLARDRNNWPQVRALFRRNPNIARFTLATMAGEAANAEAIVALSDPATRGPDSPWLPPLLNSLIAAGDYARAHALWASIARVRAAPGETVFDARFSNAAAPPPFNWALSSSPVGLAERRPGGGLHAIFYGQQDGALARQLLLLGPGTYRMTMRLSGDPARLAALSWSLRCDRAAAPLATISLAAAARHAWTVSVPAACRAQWLELVGAAGDIAQQSEVTISDLRLEPVTRG